MRSPARTATKSPRPSSPRPQQQQQQPPPPPWRLWFVGLLCAFAVVVVIERGGGAALHPSRFALDDHKSSTGRAKTCPRAAVEAFARSPARPGV